MTMNFKISPLEIVQPNNEAIRFNGDNISSDKFLFVTGDNLDDSRSIILAAFSYDTELINYYGYNVVSSKADKNILNCIKSYISPNLRSELSNFTTTVKDEILIGTNSFRPLTESAEYLKSLENILDISDLIGKSPKELSGGETAKIVMASHLVHRPQIIVLDRILGELDQKYRKYLVNIFMKDNVFSNTFFIFNEYPEFFPRCSNNRLWTISNNKVEIVNNSDLPDEMLFPETYSLDTILNSKSIETKKSLEITNLNVMRNSKKVINNFSLCCQKGQLCWLVGPNGCGKTTFYESLISFHKDWSGKIVYEGVEVNNSIKNYISYSPQYSAPDISESSLLDEISFAFNTKLSSVFYLLSVPSKIVRLNNI